jgi:hypothetical protein
MYFKLPDATVDINIFVLHNLDKSYIYISILRSVYAGEEAKLPKAILILCTYILKVESVRNLCTFSSLQWIKNFHDMPVVTGALI